MTKLSVEERFSLRKSLIYLFGGLVGTLVIYLLIGRPLIGAFYRAESLGPLEMFFDGRRIHPLSFYLEKGDALFKAILIWGGVTAVLVVGMRRLIQLNVLILGISLASSLIAAEFVARGAGLRPFEMDLTQPEVSPGGRLMEDDAKLGYVLLPGSFTVKWPTGYVSHSMHSAERTRITHPPLAGKGESPKKEIWLFGCSFTYGMSLNDQETYAWLLQEMLPDYEVVNFAVPGYATYQSLMQFETEISRRKVPDIAVYAYASFHDERNTLLRKRQKGMAIVNPFGYRQPYVRINPKGEFEYLVDDLKYRSFPLARQSALAHLVEERLDEFEDYFVKSRGVTEQLVQRFDALAREHGVHFVVAGIDSDSAKTLSELSAMGVRTVDISVDLSTRENRNWPHDSHPNATANRKYAEKLKEYLDEAFLGPVSKV